MWCGIYVEEEKGRRMKEGKNPGKTPIPVVFNSYRNIIFKISATDGNINTKYSQSSTIK